MSNGVNANYRFIGACQEINARITQRQQILALYVTLVVSLLAALVALRPTSGNDSKPVEWLMLGFPMASFYLALLNYKVEAVITNLRKFLSILERIDDDHLSLPSYNTGSYWMSEANKARSFHDFASMALVIGGNAIGLITAWQIYPERIAESQGVFYASVILALISLLILFMASRKHYSPSGS